MGIDSIEKVRPPIDYYYESKQVSELDKAEISQIKEIKNLLAKQTKEAFESDSPEAANLFEEFVVMKDAVGSIVNRALSSDINVTLAKDGERIVGFQTARIKYLPEEGKTVRTLFLYVVPDKRREGIGSELIRKRFVWLRDNGITSYITDARDSAVSVYKNMGVITSERPFKHNEKAKTLTITVK